MVTTEQKPKQTRRRPYNLEAMRKKIDSSAVLNRLKKHVHGEIKLSNTQVAAARILLAKTMPDLKAVETTGEVDVNANVTKITKVIVKADGS